MSKPPAFQFYAADYLADEAVSLMSLEEEGIYIRLLAYCWREGSIPADDELLSRLCKGASTTLVSAVKARFVRHAQDPSRLTHPHLDAERQKQELWRKKSSEGGKKAQRTRGAAARLKGGSTLQSSSSSSVQASTEACTPQKGEGDLDAEAEAIYQAYPRKVGRPDALKAIRRQLASQPSDFLLECTRRYAVARAGQDPTYTPHPATWFNQQRFNDDPATWGSQQSTPAESTNFEEF